MAYLQDKLVSRHNRLKPKFFQRCLYKDAFFVVQIKVIVFAVLSGTVVSFPVWADDCDLSPLNRLTAQKVKIDKVIDGDTVRIASGKLVRFIGINTPEIDHKFGRSEPFAEKARLHLKAIIEKYDGDALLQMGSEKYDRHGRQLSHIFTPEGKNIQADMINKGLGVWIVVPPNLSYINCYRSNEKQARDRTAGVWGEQFRKPRDTKSLTSKDTGFQWIQGKISRIGKGRKNWWLNFEDGASQQLAMGKHSKVTLRVSNDDLNYFKAHSIEELQNKVVRVKGWLGRYKKQLVMSLRHPASLEIVEQ